MEVFTFWNPPLAVFALGHLTDVDLLDLGEILIAQDENNVAGFHWLWFSIYAFDDADLSGFGDVDDVMNDTTMTTSHCRQSESDQNRIILTVWNVISDGDGGYVTIVVLNIITMSILMIGRIVHTGPGMPDQLWRLQ